MSAVKHPLLTQMKLTIYKKTSTFIRCKWRQIFYSLFDISLYIQWDEWPSFDLFDPIWHKKLKVTGLVFTNIFVVPQFLV